MSSSQRGCRAHQGPGDIPVISVRQRAVGWCMAIGLELHLQLLGLGVEGLPPIIAPAPTTCASPLQHHQPVLSLSLLSEQLTWGSSKRAGCLGRNLCWKSLPQMCAAVRSFHSTGRAVCQAARGGRGSRSRGRSPCLPGHSVTSLHVAGPLGQELLPVGSAGQSRHVSSMSPGLWPCPVLTESSEWDFQCFLWQRSLQPNYLTLMSFLLV